jgi:hypothetical protein
MTAPSTDTLRPTGVGRRVEVGRYTIPGAERILYGQRINGVVRVSDVPARGRGRAYLVDRGLELDGYESLKALVADYLEQADRLAEIPMAESALERYLATLP